MILDLFDSGVSFCQVSFFINFSTERPPVYLSKIIKMKPTVTIMTNEERGGGAYLETRLVGRTWFGPVALSPWVTVEPC